MVESSRLRRDWSRVAAEVLVSFWVYVLKSLSDARHYIGSTKDIEQRLRLHNSPVAHWTKRHQPWELLYSEEFQTRAEAVRRERQLKSFKNIGLYLDEVQGDRS